MTQKKKRVKRQQKPKLWGLEFKTFNRGIRQFLDQDYVDKLTVDEKKFLSDFNNTYYGNTFPKKDKPGPKTNMFDKAGIPRKEIYGQTNSRNRDVHTINYKIYDNDNPTTKDKFDSIFDLNRKTDYNIVEDANVDYLDFKRIVEELMVKSDLTANEAYELALYYIDKVEK